MGYTFAFPPQSAKAQKAIVAFLQENLRPWSTLVKGTNLRCHPDYDPTRFVYQGDELAYDRGRKVGFNYSTSGEAWELMEGVLNWAALRCGRLKKWKDLPYLVPYIVYDGKDAYPTLRRDEWESKCPDSKRHFLVDDDGWKRARRPWEDWKSGLEGFTPERQQEWKEELDTKDRLVKAELQRLTVLWSQRQT